MNRLERLVYDSVKRDPRVKRVIRDTYQRVCDLVPVPRQQLPAGTVVREGFFFGFHDKCPWSATDEYLLAHRVLIPLRMPGPDDVVGVGFFSGEDWLQFTPLATTRAWNWHQGAMLQWVGKSAYVLFNDYDGKRHLARVVDLRGRVQAVLPVPIAALSPDGRRGVSYDFARLRGSPYAYAYANGEDPEQDKLVATSHGLSLVDVQSGVQQLLFSVADIAQIQPEPSMRGAFHYFTHCQFSPSGARVKFFHRWLQNGYVRWTRMVGYDLQSGDLWVAPTSGMVSHVAWRDDDYILAYARTRELDDGYYLFRYGTDDFEPVARTTLTSDGHPSFSRDGRWILTDTYPDRWRARHLILYDTQTNKRLEVGSFYSPRAYVGRTLRDILSCDLHPRWNRANTVASVDSAHTGTRSLCTVPVRHLLVAEERG